MGRARRASIISTELQHEQNGNMKVQSKYRNLAFKKRKGCGAEW